MSRNRSVLIDGYNLGLEAGTGIATYARNLSYCTHQLGYTTDILYGMRPAPGFHPLLREIAFFDPAVGLPPLLAAARYFHERVLSPFRASAKRVPITGRVITTHYKSRLPYFDAIWNAANLFARAERHIRTSQFFAPRIRVHVPARHDIVHWTYPLPLYVPGAKNIYVMHDLVPLRLPYTTLDNKSQYFRLVRMLARRADHIITVSETSRKDIINLLGASESKVTNTYQSVDIPLKYASKPDDVVKREVEGTFNIKYKEYMLFFGAIEPKKNIGRLIEAFLACKSDTPLLIVGKLAWKSEQELRLLNDDATSYLEKIGSITYRRRRVFRVDHAPFPLLVSLIKGAKCVLFPSLYEGFGLPVLEAMKLGTPVLTSTEGAMPEVAGDGALLVDPYDVRAITDGITALDLDAELRGSLSAKGRKRAEGFSSEAHSRRLAEVYDAVLAKRIRPGRTTWTVPIQLAKPSESQTILIR
jgi:glycosyltransferase involved in cell wall biosynthesis